MNRERNTRAQRRIRERGERRRLSQIRGNRPLLTTGRALVLAGLLALAGGAGYVATEGGKSFPRIVSGEVQKSDGQIIQEEIQRLGIKKSQKEIDLWSKNSFVPPATPLPIRRDEATRRESETRLEQAISLMSQSENPYLREASVFFQFLSASKRVSIRLNPDLPSKEGMITVGGVTPVVIENVLGWFLDISPHQVINKLDSLSLAMKLTHEFEHIKNEYLYLQEFQALSLEEQLARLEQRYRQEWFIEEGRAYGKQSLAFVYQAGLHGIHPRGSDEELVATFIRFNNKVDSVGWLGYIERSGHVELHK